MLEFVNNKLLFIAALLAVVYFYLKLFVYNYWKKYGVPHETPSIPLGNLKISLFTGQLPMGNLFWNSYKKFSKHRFHGLYIFNRPVLMINDPELIKLVLVKDFHRFNERGWFSNTKVDPLSCNLFLLQGEQWKKLRGKLTPTFTPGKLKQMFSIMSEVCNELVNTCDTELKHADQLNTYDLIGRYATDIISSAVYGYSSSSLKNPGNDFRRLGLQSMTFGRFSMLLAAFFPDLLKNINKPFYPQEAHQFFTRIFAEAMDYRRKEKVVRKDFIYHLLQLVDKGSLVDDGEPENSNEVSGDKITMVEATAHAFVFFLAGFETTSSVVSYCLLELALNPDVQEKLYQEIKEMAKTAGFTFENILEAEYLDMVFSETERKYPGVVYLNRICVDDFPIPESNYVIPKGMRILISPLGVHYDPEHFPDPEIFDPSRFSKENSINRSPYVNLSFGEGPRNCIGKRFGILQSKLAIAMLIQKYKFFIGQKTILPVRFTSESFVVTPDHDMYLRVEPRGK